VTPRVLVRLEARAAAIVTSLAGFESVLV